MKKILLLLACMLISFPLWAHNDIYAPQTVTCKSVFKNDNYLIECNVPSQWIIVLEEPGVGTYTFTEAVDGIGISCLYQDYQHGHAFHLMPTASNYHADAKNGKWYNHSGGWICGMHGGVVSGDCPFYIN